MLHLQIHTLKVNGLTKPLGIDDYSLRFSWQLSSEARAAHLPACLIRVATSLQQLHEGISDVWESELVEGGTLFVDYTGRALDGHTRYWWQVAALGTDGHYAASEPAYWDTGLFPEDWQAEWVWSSPQVLVNDFAYLRKSFPIKLSVTYAKLFISAHNVAQVYLNGERIGGYGSPAPTHPWKQKYYLAYDITTALQPGMNCLAAVAHYLGGNGQNYVDGLPGFRAQLEVLYSDGSRDTFSTDSTWDSLIDIPHRVGTPYQQNRCISAIEDFDARKYDPDWMHVEFDRTKLAKASVAQIAKEEWPMKWQEIPEGAIEELIIPLEVGGDSYAQVFDAGKIVSGWPRLTFKGIPGVTIRMRYSEDLDADGHVKHNVCNETSEHYYDQYTMRGAETETWQPDLSYKAFRYIEITGYPEKIVPGTNLVIASAHTDIACEGTFSCSSELLNKLYAASIQTQKNNTLGQLVDCPHREQAQYLADSDLQAELLLFNFDARHMLEKLLSDFTSAQLEDGTFPFVFPSNYENPEFNLQIPEWDLHYCTVLRKLYFIYGDQRLLTRHYESAKRMVDYYISIIDLEVGLVPIDKGWHISDWPYPSVDHSSNFLTVQNIKLLQAIRIIADIASLIGLSQESLDYTQIADNLQTSIVQRLYDPELKLFRDCLGSEQTHQGVNAIALFVDLVPQGDREEAIAYVAAKQWECNTVLSLPLLRMLFENGQQEAAYRLINREEYPGWGHIINQGAKTLWEGWDDIESHCHAWNGYPARLLQEYVVGIQPLTPGFADVRIKPYMPEDLAFAEASVPTVRGHVRVRWERTIDTLGFHFTICIPVSMNAQFIVDMPGSVESVQIMETNKVIWEDNKFQLGVSGVQSCERTNAGFEIGLASGSYDFTLIHG
ncbi:family 78 glycoside hydrolase catalytic domain [Paenibacillus baekrokdamisoli]|uniref:family 78 glycoside hydrolase catalytic domain n=1 Tax=Paenibacillus baekrokdamisoli TaxID=1712516 RepID=UPI0038CD87C4